MFSKKLVGTIGVLSAAVLAPATAAHAAPSPAPTAAAHVVNLGTQVGSEGVRAPEADGIIAVLIGLAVSPAGEPPEGQLVQGRPGGVHGCPACPHPPVDVTTRPAGVATDGIGVGYRLRSAGAPSGIEPTSQEFPNISSRP